MSSRSRPFPAVAALLPPLHAAARGPTAAALAATLIGAVLVFALGAALFARGLIGGGDVKLLAAASLWAGATAVPMLLALTALFGGVVAAAFLTPLARLGAARRGTAGTLAGGQTPIPYGVAIAAAALLTIFAPAAG